jgi:hypothetical protein
MDRHDIAWVIEEIDPTSHRTREIYALHGLCMYLSQGLESIMNILIAGCYFERPKRMTQKKYDERLERGFRRTFGTTVTEWCRHEKDDALSKRLRNATITRNWLAHRYFWERAGHFVEDEGLQFMHSELTAIRDEFQGLDEVLREKTIEHNKRMGISDTVLAEEESRIRAEALAQITR